MIAEGTATEALVVRALLLGVSNDRSRPILGGAWTDDEYAWATDSYVLIRAKRPEGWPPGLRMEREAMRIIARTKDAWMYQRINDGMRWRVDAVHGDILSTEGYVAEGEPPNVRHLWANHDAGSPQEQVCPLAVRAAELVVGLSKLGMHPTFLPPRSPHGPWSVTAGPVEALVMGASR